MLSVYVLWGFQSSISLCIYLCMRLPCFFDNYYEKQREYNLTHWQHDKAYFGRTLNASIWHLTSSSQWAQRPWQGLHIACGAGPSKYLWIQMHSLCPPPWGMEEHFELIMNYNWSGTGYTFEDKQTLTHADLPQITPSRPIPAHEGYPRRRCIFSCQGTDRPNSIDQHVVNGPDRLISGIVERRTAHFFSQVTFIGRRKALRMTTGYPFWCDFHSSCSTRSKFIWIGQEVGAFKTLP